VGKLVGMTHVSVIIPHFRQETKLRECLKALAMQTYPHGQMEVIVADNEQAPRFDPSSIMTGDLSIKLISESKPGSYAARNMALGVATGDIIAFTDADCLPTPTWIENAVRRLSEVNDVCGVAGPIKVLPSCPARPTFLDRFQELQTFKQEENVLRGFAATANLVVPRTVLEKVGIFDESFFSSGDVDWGWRAKLLGLPITYCPDVVVEHPARNSVFDLLRKFARMAAGQRDIRKKYYRIPSLFEPTAAVIEYRKGWRAKARILFPGLSGKASLLAMLRLMRCVQWVAKQAYAVGFGRFRR
jgi:GT2 family glycosyltransferase